jgi:multidrug efflux pump subunit AcrA (membrane-fusion protein)
MSVEANVVTREKANALLVPADAVQGTRVFAIDGDRVRARQVEVGIRGARGVEIVSGLTDGERIIAQPPDALRDGQRVRAVERWRDNS